VCFIYVKGTSEASEPNDIVFYEKPGHHGNEGGHVAFQDGHVEFVTPYSKVTQLVEVTKQRVARSKAQMAGKATPPTKPPQTIAKVPPRSDTSPITVLTRESFADAGSGLTTQFMTAAQKNDPTLVSGGPYRCVLTCKGVREWQKDALQYSSCSFQILSARREGKQQRFYLKAALDSMTLKKADGSEEGYGVIGVFPLDVAEADRLKIEDGFLARRLQLTLDWSIDRLEYMAGKGYPQGYVGVGIYAKVINYRIEEDQGVRQEGQGRSAEPANQPKVLDYSSVFGKSGGGQEGSQPPRAPQAQRVRCAQCGGSGTIQPRTRGAGSFDKLVRPVTCSACRGSGYVTR